ncbi:MAG TPA: cation transporting ATPase C-terminal domain-containing protein, partial [Puia sp.]|nr:cation transporting ATPase C-terminal domain-containing protein [Puia sp.]
TDIPEMTIATDTVDPSLTVKPRRINLHFIRRFMIVFGIISSVYDYATFGVLLYWLKASKEQFRTAWFLESVISAALIVLVVRTSQPFYRSHPGKWLLLSTAAIVLITVLLPLTPLAGMLGFVRLPGSYYAAIGGIVLLYIATAETAKHLFYHRSAHSS